MKKKWEYNLYSFYDRTGMEQHLASMAAKGWMLEKMGRFFWVYRRAQPQPLHFSVVYFSAASEFDCAPGDAQQTLQDYCREAGWMQCAGWSQMLVFSTAMENPVPIETDAEAQVDAVHAAMKKNFLISQGLLLILALIQTALDTWELVTDLIDSLANPALLLGLLLWALIAVLSLTEILTYFLWRRRALAAARQSGLFTPTHGHRSFQITLLLFTYLTLTALLFSVSQPIALLTLGAVGWMFLLQAALSLLRKAMRRTGWSTEKNRTVTQILSFLLAFAAVGGMYYAVFRLMRDQPWQKTYTWQGETYDLHPISLPLTMEDLTGQPYPHTARESIRTRTLFLGRLVCQERVGLPQGEQLLSYTVTDIRRPWLKKAVTGEYLGSTRLRLGRGLTITLPFQWQPEPEGTWHTEEAYRRYNTDDGTPTNVYLLFSDSQVVELTLPFTPDASQRKCIVESLTGQ